MSTHMEQVGRQERQLGEGQGRGPREILQGNRNFKSDAQEKPSWIERLGKTSLEKDGSRLRRT